MKDFDMKRTRNYKTADGRVWSAPRNITTNPANKDMSKGYPHLKDEYDRFHKYQLVFYIITNHRNYKWKQKERKKKLLLKPRQQEERILIKTNKFLDLMEKHLLKIKKNLMICI